MATTTCKRTAGCTLFRVGQQLLLVGIVMTVMGVLSSHWVDRPTVDYDREEIQANSTLVTKNFGLFRACRQSGDASGTGECGNLWDNLNFINEDTVRFIQFLAIVACVLYVISLALEVVQFLPIDKYRNFLAENRVVEMFAGIASVLMLIGMVIFAGEVKNKAERVSGQEDERSGWSFIVALTGLTLSVLGLVLVTMLRELPVASPGQRGGTWLRVATQNSGQQS